MPPIRRTIKNVVRNYTDAQVKVRESTSNDPWGPSSTIMCEIADLSYNVVAFTEIMQMVWKRLNDHGKNWRHVYKSLVLLDYLIKTGSDKVAQQCKENIFAIQTLKDFQYIEDNKDQGMNVREKAKQLVQLLKDDDRLKNERAKALKAKERLAQTPTGIGSGRGDLQTKSSPTFSSDGYCETFGAAAVEEGIADMDHARPVSVGEEEIQLQLAIAMSKEEHDQSVKQQQNDNIKLQIALEESRKQAAQETVPTSKNAHLLDLTNSPQHQPVDPWGAPLKKPPQKKAQNDPWGIPAREPTNQTTVQASSDPWGVGVSDSAQSLTLQNSAHGTQVDSPNTSPWSPQATQHTNGNLDDAFDLLSSRDPSLPTDTSATLNAFDPLATLTPTSSRDDLASGEYNDGGSMNAPGKKMAERFLGANAGLVNLDELVMSKNTKGNNPFAVASASNPFEQPMAHVSMNQMASTPSFSHTSHGTMLPAPILPLNGAHHQEETVNPFL